MRVTFVILSIFTGGLLSLTAVQTIQNRAVEENCNPLTHKIVYMRSAIVDQALCIKPETSYLLRTTM
jgi:hypothetical protein